MTRERPLRCHKETIAGALVRAPCLGRKILASIAELAGDAPTRSQPTAPPEPKPRDDAERRQLTVLFTDLVGSTALSTKLDPEDLRSVIGAYHKCVAQTVGRLGGFVARYMGDGVMVYFGYPQAHEDDAERAVRGDWRSSKRLESWAALSRSKCASALAPAW